MFFDVNYFNHIYIKRVIAGAIDVSIELGSGLLGGYFGAMMAALVIVLNQVSPASTQTAIWSGMGFGFFFWAITASWMNRVLVQGMSRATIGKKMMDLEIISTGAPISWQTMMKHWISVSMVGDIKIVSTLDTSKLAPVYSIQAKPSTPAVARTEAANEEESSDKKAA